MIKFLIALITALLSGASFCFAGAPTFNSISSSDFYNITREFSENASLHDVMPASALGHFGFEIGAVGGITYTPQTNSIVEQNSPGTSVPWVPHAGLLGALSVPFGLTAELSLVPQINVSDVQYSQYTAAVKWTFSDVFWPSLPLNLAVRGFVAQTHLSFADTIQNSSTHNVAVDATATYVGTVTGAQFLVSPKMPILEPYVGVGLLSGTGNLAISGTTATVFNYTDSQSEQTSSSTTNLVIGINAKLMFLVLGAEYDRSFATDSLTGKVSLRF